MIRNGIAVEAVQDFAQALAAHPEAGAVTVRTRHRWDGGYNLACQAEELTLAGESFPRTHTIRIAMPKEFGGDDGGPVPGETLLAALGACVGQQLAEHAALREVDIDGLEIVCEAQLDLRGAYEIGDVRPGLASVSISASARTDVDDTVLDDLLQTAMRTSPAADSLANPVPLQATARHLEDDDRRDAG